MIRAGSPGFTGSEWLALGAMPSGIPVDLEVVVHDEVGETLTLVELCEEHGDPIDLNGPPPEDGFYTCTPTIASTFEDQELPGQQREEEHRGLQGPGVAAWLTG